MLLAPCACQSLRLRPGNEQFEDARLGRWHPSMAKLGLKRRELELGVEVEIEPHFDGALLARHGLVVYDLGGYLGESSYHGI